MRSSKLWLGIAVVLTAGFGARHLSKSNRLVFAANGNREEKAVVGSLDRFGGIVQQGGEPGGFFRTAKVGSRWMLQSPEGHPFWMRAVYAVDWNDGGDAARKILATKYQGDPMAFAAHAVERLHDWGFNTLGEYTSPYVYPLPTFFRPQGNPQKMPFIRFLNISWYGATNRGNLAPAPFKTLLAGAVDGGVYHDWPGHIPDVFDPNFEIYARNSAADMRTRSRDTVFTGKSTSGGLPDASLKDSPWIIGTTGDDSDYLFGFGPGPGAPSRDGVMHPNIAWVVAVTKPSQTENTEVGAAFGERQTIHYSDPVVYAKRAWRDYLVEKYGTIGKLNLAWGSRYTTFDSDGGWPWGKGLMDESGHNPWIGDDAVGLSTARPAVVGDLNNFLGMYADRYFKVVHDAITAAVPNHLVFSPAVLDSHGGLTRLQILEAAGRYCDVIQIDLNPNRFDLIEKTYAETGKPMIAWIGFKANADSAIASATSGDLTVKTQAERGSLYSQEVKRLFLFATHDGTYPILGFDWWEYMDKPAERANWGLVTPDDNAYDGKEDVEAPGKDLWGYTTGGEARDYGDFLSAVKDTNFKIDQQLNEQSAQTQANATGESPALGAR